MKEDFNLKCWFYFLDGVIFCIMETQESNYAWQRKQWGKINLPL